MNSNQTSPTLGHLVAEFHLTEQRRDAAALLVELAAERLVYLGGFKSDPKKWLVARDAVASATETLNSATGAVARAHLELAAWGRKLQATKDTVLAHLGGRKDISEEELEILVWWVTTWSRVA